MPYAPAGRVIHDADAHVVETPEWFMEYADPDVRPLLDLEGLKEWRPGRTSGYGELTRAVEDTAFYDADGEITAADYRP